MKKPTPLEAFDALYALAAADGREQALFGNSIELARPAFERTLIGSDYPTVYLEFPLLGQPGFDFLTVHGPIEPGAQFAAGAGFGYQPMFDWFASVSDPDNPIGCGIELDTSTGETEQAGVYLQQRSHHDLIEPFLESLNEQDRTQSYLDVYGRLPEGWPPAYIGLFPGRPGTPLRIGGYMQASERARCAESPDYLARTFEKIGFEAYNEDMVNRCSEFMRLAPGVDFQFDIMPDGSLGSTFGLSLSFTTTKPRQAKECMETGYGANIMNLLQSWGLADDRWKHIASAAFARHVPFEREDGTEGRLALCILFNYAKVKFTDGKPTPAKFYFACSGRELTV